jgi:predicted phosphoribosyltransferase
MRAAVLAVRAQDPERTVVAVPVASERTCEALRADADDVVCALTPHAFDAVGLWYEDFTPVSDDEVSRLLEPLPDTPRVGSPR